VDISVLIVDVLLPNADILTRPFTEQHVYSIIARQQGRDELVLFAITESTEEALEPRAYPSSVDLEYCEFLPSCFSKAPPMLP